jgi:hypothetical protein
VCVQKGDSNFLGTYGQPAEGIKHPDLVRKVLSHYCGPFLDYCMYTCNFGLVVRALGHEFVGVEIMPAHFQTAAKRLMRGAPPLLPSFAPSELSMESLEQFRVKSGLDIWEIPPDAAASMLGISVSEQQRAWAELDEYPMRRQGDAIMPGEVQWVNGDNEALEYYRQGTRLKRNKMWFQADDPLTQGFLVYKYPYHQPLVVPATFDIAKCPQLAPIFMAYNQRICGRLGAKAANHGIATAYVNGADCITPHSDDLSTIAPSDANGCSLISILKTGVNGRLFEIATAKDTAPFFSKVLPPGTLLLMTVEANTRTVHSVPAVSECGPSGSIVWRTIVNRLSVGELQRELQVHGPGGKKEGKRPAANAANAAAAVALASAVAPESSGM